MLSSHSVTSTQSKSVCAKEGQFEVSPHRHPVDSQVFGLGLLAVLPLLGDFGILPHLRDFLMNLLTHYIELPSAN